MNPCVQPHVQHRPARGTRSGVGRRSICRPDANLRARLEVQLVEYVLDVRGHGPLRDRQIAERLVIRLNKVEKIRGVLAAHCLSFARRCQALAGVLAYRLQEPVALAEISGRAKRLSSVRSDWLSKS